MLLKKNTRVNMDIVIFLHSIAIQRQQYSFISEKLQQKDVRYRLVEVVSGVYYSDRLTSLGRQISRA